jgi:mono/diheme cytochrome c family protein
MGDGPTVTAGHPPPPAYNSASLKNLPEGKMFHTITYGKNLMGAHSSQLNVEERWKVIRYVQTLQNPDGDKEEEASTEESTAEGDAVAAETEMNN